MKGKKDSVYGVLAGIKLPVTAEKHGGNRPGRQ